MKNRIFASLVLVCSAASLPWTFPYCAANTYRWVDDNGQVHYGDHMPAQDADRAYSVINREGITVNSVGKAKTKEQLEEEQHAQQQQAEQQRAAHERAAYDHILLDTYTKVGDLEDTRDRYISSLEGLIKISQHKLSNLNSDLDKFNKQAAGLNRQGKPVPQDLSKDISTLQSQIEQENKFVQTQRAHQKEIGVKFAADIQRFKELKGEQQSNSN
jgi:hypothetical protein